MIASSGDPFPAGDLETNRSGRLTDAQLTKYKSLARAGRRDELFGAVFCVAMAVLLLAPAGPSPNVWARPLGAAVFILVGLLLFRTSTTGDSLTQDMRSGRVEMVEGAIGKHKYEREGSHTTWTDHYLDVAGRSFEVDSTAFLAAPDVGYVRLYVLPRSHVIVNLERMPDRPLPTGATTSTATIVADAITAARSHDTVKAAEARAELDAIGNALQAERSSAATPPPADQRDPRPLAEAIVGTWQTGPMSISFLPDGTMVVRLPGGRERHERWSVGADGRLHASGDGRDTATDAWVAGDALTISENGQGMVYRRTAAG
ncbi:MAG TPA: hypothetical protein VF344_08505 [Candidatus Limnocylindrales bacterium]